jgi:hypothetical protein
MYRRNKIGDADHGACPAEHHDGPSPWPVVLLHDHDVSEGAQGKQEDQEEADSKAQTIHLSLALETGLANGCGAQLRL